MDLSSHSVSQGCFCLFGASGMAPYGRSHDITPPTLLPSWAGDDGVAAGSSGSTFISSRVVLRSSQHLLCGHASWGTVF